MVEGVFLTGAASVLGVEDVVAGGALDGPALSANRVSSSELDIIKTG